MQASYERDVAHSLFFEGSLESSSHYNSSAWMGLIKALNSSSAKVSFTTEISASYAEDLWAFVGPRPFKHKFITYDFRRAKCYQQSFELWDNFLLENFKPEYIYLISHLSLS